MLENIRALIGDGDLLIAMNELGAQVQHHTVLNDELTLLKGRTARVERDYKAGLMTRHEREADLARLTHSLLDLVGRIEKAGATPPTPPMPARVNATAVENLLLTMFGADELRRFLASDPQTAPIGPKLPGATASLADLTHQAVTALVQHGLFDDALRDRLLAARPARAREIRAVLGRTQ